MNALLIPDHGLETREIGDRPEVRCPTCGEWRPGFCVVPRPEPGDGPAFWCDADVAIGARETEAELKAADLGALELALHSQIDTAAGNFRRMFITDIAGQAQTYDRKEREARAWLAAEAPDATDFPFLAAEAGATGDAIADVAALIVANADLWALLGAAVEGQRIGAKRAVSVARAAGDRAAMESAAAVDWQALAP